MRTETSPIDYSAMVIAESLGYLKNDILNDPDMSDSLKNVLENIKYSIRRHQYSKESLLALIKTNYLHDKTNNELFELIGTSPICNFPDSEDGSMAFRYRSQNPPRLRSDYGTEAYRPIQQHERTARQRPDNGQDQAIAALKNAYNQLRKEEPYFWQWKACTDDYTAIKVLLGKIQFNSREIIQECSEQLSFYIAEWFKREYNGNNDDGCLQSLNIDPNMSRVIWTAYYGTITGTERPTTDNSTGYTPWLYFMYIQGGFPLNYIKTSNKYDCLIDSIWGGAENRIIEEDFIIDKIENFTNVNNVEIVNQSLRNPHHSLNEYYRHLLKRDVPAAEADLDKEPFFSFIKLLKEGRPRNYQNFFKPEWLIYHNSGSNVLYFELRISFGFIKDKGYIPYDCLEQWNISDLESISDFDISVSCDEDASHRKQIHFSKNGHGRRPFVGWTNSNQISLDITPGKPVHVKLITNGKTYTIGKDIQFEGKAQFYKTERPYQWSTRTNNSTYTGVLFDPIQYSLNNKELDAETEDKQSSDNKIALKWLQLNSQITLTGRNGSEFTYSPQNNALKLRFKQIKAIKYKNLCIEYELAPNEDDTETISVPLLYDQGLIVEYTPYNESTVVLRNEDYELRFKQDNDSIFKIWHADNKPRQGLIRIKVTYNSISEEKQVYYIPGKNPIIRKTDDRHIVFKKCIATVFAPSSENKYYELQVTDNNRNHLYLDNLTNGYEPQEDTIPFIIGNPNEAHTTIRVYRSDARKELYLKNSNSIICSYRLTDTIDIPAILRNNFEIRNIDGNGVNRTECDKNAYIDYEIGHIEEDGINYYVTKDLYVSTADLQRNGNLQVRLDTDAGSDAYRFYYWSMLQDDEPSPIETCFDRTSRTLTIQSNHTTGIIFQSIKDGVTPRHYICPRLLAMPDNQNRNTIRVTCFNIASQHGIPYQVFTCLKEMFTNADTLRVSLAGFFQEFMRLREWHPSEQDYINLHRFANEFLFDWIMIPRIVWIRTMLKNQADNTIGYRNTTCRNAVNSLLKTTPDVSADDRYYLNRIIDTIYWQLPAFREDSFRRSQRPENKLMQCIRGISRDCSCFCNNHEGRIRLLREAHTCQDLYRETYTMMNNIMNQQNQQ